MKATSRKVQQRDTAYWKPETRYQIPETRDWIQKLETRKVDEYWKVLLNTRDWILWLQNNIVIKEDQTLALIFIVMKYKAI